MLKFGKKSKDILEVKKSFITENKSLFKWQRKLYKLYSNQPKRKYCKNCEKKIKGERFEKLGIEYIICNNCKHVNGIYQDTKLLSKKFYQTDEAKSYSKIYLEKEKKDYNKRIKNIYLPKANFLIENLKKREKINYIKNKYQFIDIGCGSGYFLSSLKKLKIKNIKGYDPSKNMVDYGNYVNNFKILNFINHENTIDEIKKIDKDKKTCVSMIGSLEHIYNQNDILREIKRKKNIKYLYIVVPCFSPTSFVEMIFNKNFQRLLAPQHTHLYTSQSLKYLEKMFNLKIIGEWWFGADIVDLYRNFLLDIKSKETKNKKMNTIKIFNKMFLNLLDNLQLEIDKKKLSSEAHIIYKVNN